VGRGIGDIVIIWYNFIFMQILKILETLSFSKDDKIIYLTNLGTYPSTDELALEFDDAYKFSLNIILEKMDTDSACCLEFLNKLKEIDAIFDKMSDVKLNIFWDVSSLDCEEWNKIRRLAKEALDYSENIF